MAVNKLPEFAKNGQKNTDGLNLEDGFPVNLKPARQWFNFLFNNLSLAINQIIDEKANLSGATFTGEVVSTSSNSYRLKNAKRGVFWRLDENNLYLMKTPDNSPDAGWDETRPIMWEFKTNKLFLGADVEFSAAKGNLTGNASTASKLQIARTVQFDGAATGSFSYDGSGNSSCLLTLANSGVAAGSYASTIQIPQISVNAAGQITAISQQNIRSSSVTQSGVVQLVDDLATADASKALTAKQGRVLQETKFNISGGTVTGSVSINGRITAAQPTPAFSIIDLGDGSNSPIIIPRVSIKSNYRAYIPFLHGSTISDQGFVSHLSFGGYRENYSWDGAGAYIAVGGNDLNPTEAFLFKYGGIISHSTGSLSIEGNSSTSSKLETARNISISGDANGATSFDGSSNKTINLLLNDVNNSEGTYGANNIQIPVFTLNKKGLLTSASNRDFPLATMGQHGATILYGGLDSESNTYAAIANTVRTLNIIKLNVGQYGFGGEGNNYQPSSDKDFINQMTRKSQIARRSEGICSIPNYSAGIYAQTADTYMYICAGYNGQGVVALAGTDSNDDVKVYNLATLNDNVASASKLKTSRNIALSGAVSGNADFDGSGNIVINAALNNFSSYKAENGYKYLGDGTILQWGRIDSDAAEKNVTVTFPITFPNGCLNISMTRLSAYSTSATSEADGDALVVEGTITNYSFVANLQRFNTSTSMLRGAMWFAIGH